jgi:putative tryptophan/tyrosine transport system substrate-binding protein
MNRRAFITLVGGGALAWSFGARAQQPAMPVIGFLSNLSPGPIVRPLAAFRRGLEEAGYVEGHNVAIAFRWAGGHNERLPELAADLVQHRVSVIVATGGGVSALAAKAATATIPIVFSTAADPVELGLVAALNRPGGNATGVFILANELEGKRLGLLHEMVPQAETIAMLINPQSPRADKQRAEVEAAARTFARRLLVLPAQNEAEIDAAIARLPQPGVQALLVAADPLFNSHREQLIALSARHALPTIYEFREFAAGGGLMSYGPSLTAAYHQVGLYAGKVLKGEKPENLPVLQPTTFELVINLKTAKTLGLIVPQTLQVAADEVIE